MYTTQTTPEGQYAVCNESDMHWVPVNAETLYVAKIEASARQAATSNSKLYVAQQRGGRYVECAVKIGAASWKDIAALAA